LLGDLRREGVADRIDLAGLSMAEIGELVELVLEAPPRPGTVERLRASTEGNPLFLRELLRVAREDPEGHLGAVPEGVRELIERRLARVAGPVARALQAGAVAGRTFDLRVLEACEDLADSDVLEALEDAASARLVSEVPGRPGCFQFSHQLVRDALYASLSAARRARLHLQVAGALEEGAGLPAEPAEIAHHLLQAGDQVSPERVVAAMRRAAERASAQAAHEEAAEYFEDALAAADAAGFPTDERCDLMLAAGGARARGGEVGEARALFARAAELARGRDPERLAIAALGVLVR
jgi:predicted ATPase